MDTTKIRNIHIWISLIFFALCLALPGYYIREAHEPQLSIYLLMMGWLGIFDGHLSWFANVFFLIALIKRRKPRTSSYLGFTALAFALSFLGYEKIVVSEAPTYAHITAYGLGYMFWVASIGILSVGQYSLAADKSEKEAGALLSGWVVLVLSLYSVYYFVGDYSLHSINVGRDSAFEEKCRVSRQNLYVKTSDANAIFFDPYFEPRFRRTDSGDWRDDGRGQMGLHSYLLFYETRNRKALYSRSGNFPKYTRHESGDSIGVEADGLLSEYAVIAMPFDIPKQYGIEGAEIVIKDLRNETIVATTTYIYDPIDSRFCGHAPDGRFWPSRFVIDALNLTKKIPPR